MPQKLPLQRYSSLFELIRSKNWANFLVCCERASYCGVDLLLAIESPGKACLIKTRRTRIYGI